MRGTILKCVLCLLIGFILSYIVACSMDQTVVLDGTRKTKAITGVDTVILDNRVPILAKEDLPFDSPAYERLGGWSTEVLEGVVEETDELGTPGSRTAIVVGIRPETVVLSEEDLNLVKQYDTSWQEDYIKRIEGKSLVSLSATLVNGEGRAFSLSDKLGSFAMHSGKEVDGSQVLKPLVLIPFSEPSVLDELSQYNTGNANVLYVYTSTYLGDLWNLPEVKALASNVVYDEFGEVITSLLEYGPLKSCYVIDADGAIVYAGDFAGLSSAVSKVNLVNERSK